MIWLIMFAVLVAFLNIVHVVLPIFSLPQGTFYSAVGHFSPDYFGMLSFISQGAAGEWRAYNLFTSENLPGFWLTAWPYLLLGKISGILFVPPQAIYWAAVFFLSLAVILAVYYLATLCLQEKRYLVLPVFLVYLFSGPFVKIETIAPLKFFLYSVTWYYHTGLFGLSVIPHYLLSSLFILLIFITSYYYFKNPKPILLIGLTVLFGFVLFLTPIKVTYLFPAFALSAVSQWRDLKRLAIMGISLLLFGLILRADISQNYFPAIKAWEEAQMDFPSLSTFLLGSGLTFILAVLCLPYFILKFKKIHQTIFFGLIATILSYLLFYTRFSLLFGNHNSRLLFPEAYFFLAYVLVLTLARTNLLWIVTSLLIVLSLPSAYLSLEQRRDYMVEGVPPILQYPPQEIVAGFNFIRANSRRHELVLASKQINVILPIFTNTKTYASREYTAPDFESKDWLMFLFYQGRMDPEVARDFLRENNFKYVVLTMFDEWINRERTFNSPPFLDTTPILKPVFANSQIKIFEVLP